MHIGVQKCRANRWTQLCAILFMYANLIVASSAFAEVTTRIDRPSVDLNESFQLEIVVDTDIDIEPDFSILDEKFYRGQLSRLDNTSIINGQISRSRTWSIPLMAKSAGSQEIPAIAIGNEKSLPISIIVNEPSDAPPGQADVFVTSEVDQTDALVQAQILYRIKVYRAVATRQPSLTEPTITGAEALVELAGEERSYEAILNGNAYNVVERVLAIYPQESGEISISPARFEARVLRGGRITGRKIFESDAHTITVKPIPPPPADFPHAAWLPALDLRLSEEWSREPDNIDAGEPVTRHVTISALGQLETQIPAFDPPMVDGMNVYADKPELSRRIEAGGIRGVRKDQYALIGVRGGVAEIPELVVPWWDISAGEWRFARLASRKIDIDAPQSTVIPDLAAAPEVALDLPLPEPDEPASTIAADSFWKTASQLLGAAWLLTLIAWWWSSRNEPREIKPAPPPIYKQQAKLVKAARKASSAGDAAGARAALIEWGRLQWPNNGPRSVGEIALRVAPPLADELNKLSAASYGSKAGEWDGQGLAKALRSIDVLAEGVGETAEDMLPPLLPPGI